MINNVAVIVPAFNEGTTLKVTIDEICSHFKHVFVIDDGSSDNSTQALKSHPCVILRHVANLGQGAAIQTGVVYALKETQCEYFLTMDADGQHDINSAIQMCEEITKKQCDIIIGSRFLGIDAENMPKLKKFLLKVAIFYTRLDTGLKLTDTHNGLRIFSRDFAKKLQITQHGMAHASEFLSIISSTKSSWYEFPVKVNYTDHSLKKGQSMLNSINILTEKIFK